MFLSSAINKTNAQDFLLRFSKTALHFLRHSVFLRLLIFGVALWGVAVYGRLWNIGWLRKDEAVEIADVFLARQGADVQKYTIIQAVERRRDGLWSAPEGEQRFDVSPAIGYFVRYFRPGVVDGWSIAVAPTGRIYRVQREQPDDEPSSRLNRAQAFDLVVSKLATDIGLPAYSLRFVSDSLVEQFQRTDWHFVFRWPEVLDSTGTLQVTLSGDALTDLSFHPARQEAGIAPLRTERSSRVLGFILILGGVFLIMQYHRTPLALKSAGLWGAVVFLLTLLMRGLTFMQAVILMPSDVPLAGYLSRIALSAVVEALQNAMLLGLVVATGEALSRDVFRGSATLSRIPSGTGSWRAAWAKAARWAFPAAAIVLVYEAMATHYLGPVGLCSKVPALMANTLSSHLPVLALPSQLTLDMLWEECVYRLWLLSLLLFWLRLPILAVPLAAGAAAYFAGFDISQFATVGGVFYLAWGLLAGFLMVRVGIIAAMLLHLAVVAGYAALVLWWTGFGANIGLLLIAAIFLLVLIVAHDDPAGLKSPAPASPLESLAGNG